MNNLTLVLTSCGRLDLLDETVKSIPASIRTNIKKILIDDSGKKDVHDQIKNNPLFSDWLLLFNEENIGQPKSVDKAYSFVETDYVFHCEDDWLFDNDTTFIHKAIDILERYENIFQVTFRKDCPHPTQPTSDNFVIKTPGWRNEWYGFTYNPSIIKMKCVKQVLPYSGKNEQQIGKLYYDLGLFTAAIHGVVHHIGYGRSTMSHIKL
jgi:hypothetical protein